MDCLKTYWQIFIQVCELCCQCGSARYGFSIKVILLRILLKLYNRRAYWVGRDPQGSLSSTPGSTWRHSTVRPCVWERCPNALLELQQLGAVPTALGRLFYAHHPLVQTLSPTPSCPSPDTAPCCFPQDLSLSRLTHQSVFNSKPVNVPIFNRSGGPSTASQHFFFFSQP